MILQLALLAASFIVIFIVLNSLISKKAQQDHEELNKRLIELNNQIISLSDLVKFIKESHRIELLAKINRDLSGIHLLSWRLFAHRKFKTEYENVRNFKKNSKELIERLNNQFIEKELDEYKTFFDKVEKNPLTSAQRRACVIDQDHNLVLAGAGTGKTSTMIGRAGYLIEADKAHANEILMMAFSRKAAMEMQERISEKLKGFLKSGQLPTASTFHAVGLRIISEVEGTKPSLSRLSEDGLYLQKFIDDSVVTLSKENKYAKRYVKFQLSHKYPCRLAAEFESIADYNKYVQVNKLRTINGELVKSYEEVLIANFLFSSSIKYEYEKRYEYMTANKFFRQYYPDFYLTDYDIYLEHFALNNQGKAPEYFNKGKEHTYEEGVEWKRKLHKEKNTTLLETFSHMQKRGKLLDSLKKILIANDVEIITKSDEELIKAINESQNVSEFSSLAKKFILFKKQTTYSFPQLYQKAKSTADTKRSKTFLDLLQPIYEMYEEKLEDSEEIDFSDMIRKATDYVSSGKFHSQYKHILIDEFQDISPARAGLVKSLIEQNPSTSLFVVGDDWQSIYRFTGSDLNIMVNLSKEFGYTDKTVLDTTFRFNDQIGKCSSTFVQKNSFQIEKSLKTIKTSDRPEISTIKTSSNLTGLHLAITAIGQENRQKIKVLVLARYHHLFNEVRESGLLKKLHQQFRNIKIELMSIHASKGKEADYVVLIGLLSDELPAEKPLDDILELLLPKKEGYPYAEERRLFYVALTRAKDRVYLVYNPLDPSPFMTELGSGEYNICVQEIITGEFDLDAPMIKCPECERGFLSIKNGQHGSFVGCSKYPICRHTENVCPFCESGILQESNNHKVCMKCDARIPICPNCGGNLLVREGKYGQFLGCSNYRSDDDFACNYTRKIKSYSRK